MQPLPRSILDEHIQKARLPIVLQNVQGNASLLDAALYAESNIHTLLCARMLHEEDWIGTLNVFSFEARDFTDDELILLQGIADEAALAIANARLYNAVQQGELARTCSPSSSPFRKMNECASRAICTTKPDRV